MGIAGAAGEIDDGGDTQFFRQQDGFPADLPRLFRQRLLSGCSGLPWQLKALMRHAVVLQLLLEFLERGCILQHRQLAVSIPGIVSRPQLHGIDLE